MRMKMKMYEMGSKEGEGMAQSSEEGGGGRRGTGLSRSNVSAVTELGLGQVSTNHIYIGLGGCAPKQYCSILKEVHGDVQKYLRSRTWQHHGWIGRRLAARFCRRWGSCTKYYRGHDLSSSTENREYRRIIRQGLKGTK